MLANLPVEIILLICEYPEFEDLGQLAWTNKRIMRIIKRYLPIALEIAFERKTLLFWYQNSNSAYEGRIGFFSSYTCSVEKVVKFYNWYEPYQVATTQNKVFRIEYEKKLFEIYDLRTGQISRGQGPPKWREWASVAYFKGKLYYLGGNTNRVDVLIDGKWQRGPAFPHPISRPQTITCNEILYIIDGRESRRIYRLSDNEREWKQVGNIPEKRYSFGVASLSGRIYITGGENSMYGSALTSCLCFDPSAPVDSRISRIADMGHSRYDHSLIAANGKLYVIGGRFPSSVEAYDPQTNEWQKVGILRNLSATSENIEKKTRTNRTKKDTCLLS